MSVHGGRSLWLGAVARGGLLSVAAFSWVVGCGSRTSMLDPDAYGVGTQGVGDDDDDSGGRPATGGRPNGSAGKPVGAAGKPSGSGATASGGSSGADVSAVVAACRAYCPGYGSQCAARLMGQDCLSACINEIVESGASCQKLGISALNCLSPFFTPGGFDCDSAVNRGLTKCSKAVDSFEKCKGVPSPKPTMPVPSASVTDCPSSAATGTPNVCQSTYSCANGIFSVYCLTDPETRVAACGCVRPNGVSTGSNFMSTLDVCEVAARSLCD